MNRRLSGVAWVVMGLALCATGCGRPVEAASVDPGLSSTTGQKPPIEISDALETLIESGSDTEKDRKYAYQQIQGAPDDGTAQYAFARAAVAGRLAELRGLQAGGLVTETETYARKCNERDPTFRDGAATRMLGTLYVLAPPRLVEHGDSEIGLEMLEKLTAERPDDPRNHLRVAEAYVALGDPEPGYPHLCRARARADQLRADERTLLEKLVEDAGGEQELSCEQSDAAA